MTNEDKEMIKCTILLNEEDDYYLADYYLPKSSPLATFKNEYNYNPFVKEDYLLQYDVESGIRHFWNGEFTDILIIKTEFSNTDKKGLYKEPFILNTLLQLGSVIKDNQYKEVV